MSVSSFITSSEAPTTAGRSPGRFLVVFVFALTLACGLVAAVNVAVDPFGFFGINRTGLFFNDERTFKLMQVRNYPHEALLLGDSRAAYIDPGAIESPRVFNGAFGGATLDEMLWFWENYEGDARVVVIGLLFADLGGEPSMDERLKERTWRDYFRYALSFELLGNSFEALDRWRAGEPPTYNENGSRAAREKRIEELRQGTVTGSSHAAQNPTEIPHLELADLEPCSRENRPKPSRIVPGWERLVRIADIAKKRGTKLIVFMHPRHPEDIADYAKDVGQAGFVNRINFLCSLGVEFLDFTISKYSAASNFWVADRFHYKPEVGLSLLADIFRRSDVPVEMK